MGVQIDWERVASFLAAERHSPNTRGRCLYWARRFVDYGASRNRDPIVDLTRLRATQVVTRILRAERKHRDVIHPLSALHAFSCALASLGYSVPVWVTPRPMPDATPLLTLRAR